MRRLAALVAVLVALAPGAPAAAASVAGMNAFVAQYHEVVFRMLSCVHAHPMTPRGRFVVLSVRPDRYVQCLFLDGDSQLLCEGASGYFGHGRPVSAAGRYALARMGFSMDRRHGNYQLLRPVTGPAAVWDAAGIMLEAFYRAYGARPDAREAVSAPLLEGLDRDVPCPWEAGK